MSTKCKLLPMVTLIFISLLFTQNAIGQCSGQCLPNTAGNGPDPCEAKLYCSNSGAVPNGIINCTNAADTDGCGVLASVASNFDDPTEDIFTSNNVPEDCFKEDGTRYSYIQWIVFTTPPNINTVKLQGVGQMDSWAVFHAGAFTVTSTYDDEGDMQVADELETGTYCNSLDYVEFACSNANQYETWTNPDAVIADNMVNVYYIALMYDRLSNGSINFKVKECDLVEFCTPVVDCPDAVLTFCEGLGDDTEIDNWLILFTGEDCGNTLESEISNGDDATLANIKALMAGNYTVTNKIVDADGNVVLDSDGNPLECEAEITIYSQPEAGTGEDASYCIGAAGLSSVDLDAQVTGGDAGGSWTDANGAVVSPIDLSAATAGDYTFTYTVAANGDCLGDNTSVTITIYDQPEAGTGTDDSYCIINTALGSVDLDALVTGGDAGGSWTDANGAVVSPVDLSAATAGDYTFTYTVAANGDCLGDNTSVTITIYDQPEAGTGTDDSYCIINTALGSVDLDALVTGGDAGGSWTDANGAVVSPVDLSAATAGDYTFTYTVAANGDCLGDNTSVTITIYAQPEAGTGTDDSYCIINTALGSVDLDALVTGGDAGGSWTDANGAVVSPVDLSAATAGDYTFTYTVAANGDCLGDNTSVTITIYAQPEAGTGTDDSYCIINTALGSVDLDALVTGGDAGGSWTDANGAVVSPVDLSAATAGDYTFTYTVAANGDCLGDNTSVTITIYAQPEAGTGTDDSYCIINTALGSVDLDALVTGGDAGGSWTDANGAVVSPIDLSAATAGDYTFTYTVAANGDCLGDNTSVTITIYAQPEAGTGTDDSYCIINTALGSVDLDALVTGGDAGGSWTDANGAVVSPVDLSAATAGDYTFTYTVAANGDCLGDNTSVTITIYDQPEAGTGTDDSYCIINTALGSVDLDALVTGGDAGGSWTDANGGVVSPIDLSAATAGDYTFTYTVAANGDCLGDNTSVTITIYDQPEAGTGTDDSYCIINTALGSVDLDALVTGGDAGGSWTDANGAVVSPIDLSAATAGDYTFTYTVAANGDCLGDNTSVTITIYDQPEAGTGTDDSYCIINTALGSVDLDALVTGGDAGGSWTDANGGVVSPIDLSAATAGDYTFTYTVAANGDCLGDNTSVTITIYDQPEAGTGTDDSYCIINTALGSVDLDALVTGGDAGGSWTDANGGVVSPIDLSAATAGDYTFTYTVAANGDCLGDNTSVTITIYAQPEAGTGTDDSYCIINTALGSVDLDALVTGGDAGGSWTDANGAVVSPIDLSAATAGDYTFTYTVAANGDCLGDNTSVTITIYAQPEAGTGTDDSYCIINTALGSVDLDALVTGGDAGGSWTDANGGVVSPIDLSAATAGDYTFTYTVAANGDCLGDNTSVTITIYDQPEAGTGTDDSYCIINTALGSVDLDALVTGGDAGGSWTDANGGVVSPIDLSAATAGDYTFTYTVAANGDCLGDNTSVTITIYDQPEAGTGTDDSYCIINTALGSVDLDALVTGGDAGGSWTDANGAVVSPVDLSAATAGDYTFTYTVAANGDCLGDNTSVTITIYDQPEAGTGENASYCIGAVGLSSVDLDAQVTGGDTGGSWTDANGGVVSPIDLSAAVAGTYTYTYTVAANGDCDGDDTEVTITMVDCYSCSDETAFAYNSDNSLCFLDQQKNPNKPGRGVSRNNTRWGWTNNIGTLAELANPNNPPLEFQLVYGNGGGNGNDNSTACEPKGDNIGGTVSISYNGGSTLTVTYAVDAGNECEFYTLGDLHVYLGTAMLPDKLAPGQYGNTVSNSLTVEVPVGDFSGDDMLYMIAHAELGVCSCVAGPCLDNCPGSALVSNDTEYEAFDYAQEVNQITDVHSFDSKLEESSALRLRAYPNPSVDYVTVEADGLAEGTTELRITDYLGREVLKDIQQLDRSSLKKKIDLDGKFMPGLYYISIINNGSRKVIPVAVIK